MGLTYKKAMEIAAASGKANEYVDRFIGSVKSASLSGNSAAISMDDALVVSMVLCRLLETPEGRKLTGRPKGKNTRWKAKDFRLGSPQLDVVIDYLAGQFEYQEALQKFEKFFDEDRRTLKNLFDDLVISQEEFNRGCREMLIAAGACGKPGSQKDAADKIIRNIVRPDGFAK